MIQQGQSQTTDTRSYPDFFRRTTPLHVNRSQVVLQWALREFGDELVLATSLGPQSLVILDLLASLECGVRTIFLDTGLMFDETVQLKDRVERHFGIAIESVRPMQTVEEMSQREGPTLWQLDPDRCCALRKVEPLRRALAGERAWITGIRRSHSKTRAETQPIEWDENHGLVKVNPLAEWTREQVMEHLEENGVPYNPLLRDGYTSIGCSPCTRRASGSDDERAGRWAGNQKTECGIHGPSGKN